MVFQSFNLFAHKSILQNVTLGPMKVRGMKGTEAKELAMGCPGGGCGSCASGLADGSAGCGASGPSATRSGPVLVQLSLRQR